MSKFETLYKLRERVLRREGYFFLIMLAFDLKYIMFHKYSLACASDIFMMQIIVQIVLVLGSIVGTHNYCC